MRPLVLAAFLAALAGCSLPYEGTSFKADPKLESALRGHGKEEGHEGAEHKTEGKHEATADGEGEHKADQAMRSSGDDFPDVPSNHWAGVASEKSPMDRTRIVFPPTAQPGE